MANTVTPWVRQQEHFRWATSTKLTITTLLLHLGITIAKESRKWPKFTRHIHETHTHIHIHTYTHTHLHTYTHTRIHTYTRTYTHPACNTTPHTGTVAQIQNLQQHPSYPGATPRCYQCRVRTLTTGPVCHHSNCNKCVHFAFYWLHPNRDQGT